MTDADPPRLIFTKNSLRNTSIACDSLGIHYQLETPTDGLKSQRITKLSRWNSEDDTHILVAEWERNIVKNDRFRIVQTSTGDADFLPLKEIFPVTWGDSWGRVVFNRTFIGYDGRKYVWKARAMSLKAFVIDGATQEEKLVASFHRRNIFVKRKKSYIELYPGYENSLDLILLFCLFCDRKRRDHERRH